MTSHPPDAHPPDISPFDSQVEHGSERDDGANRLENTIWLISSNLALQDQLKQYLTPIPQGKVSFDTGKAVLSQLNRLFQVAADNVKPPPSFPQPVGLMLIASDLVDMTGISLLKRIRQKYPNLKAAALIIGDEESLQSSSQDPQVLRESAFQAGAADCLLPPLIAAEIQIKVGNFLELQSTLVRQLSPSTSPQISPAVVDETIEERPGSEQLQDDYIQTLESENQYLKIILDNLPQQVFWKDRNLRFLGCNQRWAEAAGISHPSAILGKTDFDLVPNGDLAQKFQDKDQYVLTTGSVLEETIAKVKADSEGNRRWLDVTRQPLLDTHNQQIGVMGVINDVTQQYEAEERLRLAEEKYREIFENAVEGLFQISTEGQFLSVNPALARLYGYSSPAEMIQEVTNLDDQIYSQPKRRQEILAYLQQFSELTDFESLVRRKDGQRFWVSENIRQVQNDEGEILYLEGSVTDVTEKRQAEMNLRKQRQQSERLLLNILPQMIAQRLKTSPGLVADNFKEATVLFADIVGFTEWASQIDVSELVKVLNNIFSEFDLLAEEIGIEKIKTIGDAYMAVSGVPTPIENHAERMAEMALRMQEVIGQFYRRSHSGKEPFRLRIGMHSGAVSAGVVGLRKFFYDLWGDTVNVASRMESQGTPGRIQVTHETYLLIKDKFYLEFRGEFKIKGKGTMQTYWLLGQKPETTDEE